MKIIPLLKGRNRFCMEFTVKVLVSIIAVVTVMYYIYACGFRSNTTILMNYAFHIADVVFALDYYFDMIQVVVTPQSKKEFSLFLMFQVTSWAPHNH